ncbi:putative Serine/threonine-protein kinase PLK4 [Hypsibius exemplaris]|uniref:Serine/threonine-protein kinase SAK n=1 Tax=Hypsibius exemplaris TaxID=2072580 RepID=A0A1W0WLW6_HYPEX|nr:putative Serine/threonine-protein kinase PLK4 [Hypsibius exemplaris]
MDDGRRDDGTPFGREITDFIVGPLLGTGSFGEVYLAKSRIKTDMRVAIKHFNRKHGHLKPEDVIQRIIKELAIHKQLKHPNIATFYGYFADSDYIYLVMELFDCDLEAYLRDNMPLAPRSVKEIFWEIVRGVQYLHDNGIIHRDLKPGNILLKDGGKIVKLCDFGLATEPEGMSPKSGGKFGGRVAVKPNSTFCGTPDFSPPEMFRLKDRDIKTSADVYSLGVILYTMLTGARPFQSSGKTLKEIGREKTSLTADYSMIKDRSARDLVQWLMKPREDDRPSTKQILQHPWLAEMAQKQESLMSSQNISLDSGNGSDRSDSSTLPSPRSRARAAAHQQHSPLGMIPEGSFSRSSFSTSSINLSSIDQSGLSPGSRNGYSGLSLPVRSEKLNTPQRQRLEPVNTEHLEPVRVMKTYGNRSFFVSILESGEVAVEFLKCKSGTTCVTAVVRMSSGNAQVVHYNLASGDTLVSDAPPPVPYDRRQPYSLYDPDLPPRAGVGAKIAAAFVESMKRKTIKHWIATTIATSNLMRNEPNPNVETIFHDGVKIIHSDKKIEIRRDSGIVQILSGSLSASQLLRKLHEDFQNHWKHHRWCKTELLNRDQQTRELEGLNPDIKIVAMGYARKPKPGLPFLRHDPSPPACVPEFQPSGPHVKSSLERSPTSGSRSFNAQGAVGTPHEFEDKMRVTVYNGGDFLKFDHHDDHECRTYFIADIPERYEPYVKELQQNGYLRSRSLRDR